MMMQNTLFRCGGSAVLLSSNFRNRNTGAKAMYKLIHSGRTLLCDDDSYR